MKLYLVERSDYDGSIIEGIYLSAENAVALVRSLNPRYKTNWPYNYDINVWESDSTEPIGYINNWEGVMNEF